MAQSAAEAMQAAIDADGGAGLPGGGDVAPGAGGGGSSESVVPPAGAQNTDTPDNGAPDTIPYPRFKEVNDAYVELKDFKPLLDYGYDSDSLGQLAAFHQAYSADPVGTWAGMADNLDLPQELKDQLKAHLDASAAPTGPGAGNSSEPPAPQAPELPEDVKKRLEYVDQLKAERESDARNAQLDRVLAAWTKLEVADEIPEDRRTSERMKLNLIAAAGASGQQFASVEDLAKAGYDMVQDHNTSVLGGAVRTGRTGAPLSVPGGAPAPAEPVRFTDIRSATKAAEAAIGRGELPSLK